MKKLLVVLLFFSTMTLAGCNEEDPIDDPIICNAESQLVDGVCVPIEIEEIECTENQILEGDTCIDLSGSEIALRYAFENSIGLNNYKLTTLVENQGFILEVDEEIRKLVTPTYTEYFKVDGDTCYVKHVFNDVVTVTSDDCVEGSPLFYEELEYSWFELSEGKYSLLSEYNETLSAYFDGSVISSFQLSIKNGYINEMFIEFDGLSDSLSYIMTLEDIGVIELDYDEVPE